MFLQEASEIQGSQKSFKLPYRNSSDIVVTTLSSRVNYEENRRHSDLATVLFDIKWTEQIHTAGVKIVRRRLFNYQQNHFISDEVKTRGKVRISGNVGILTDSF